MEILTILSDHIGSGKSNMAAAKVEVHIYQFVDKIGMRFLTATSVISGSSNPMDTIQTMLLLITE
jgi:hypothetical protein